MQQNNNGGKQATNKNCHLQAQKMNSVFMFVRLDPLRGLYVYLQSKRQAI